MFSGGTAAEAEAPMLWTPNVKSWLTGMDPDAEKDWRQKGEGAAKDGMFRRHHWLSGHGFKQTPGDSGGQRSLVGYGPWGGKLLDTT